MDLPSFKHTATVYTVLVLVSSVAGGIAYSVLVIILRKFRRIHEDEESVSGTQAHTTVLPVSVSKAPSSVKLEVWKPLRRNFPNSSASLFKKLPEVVSTPEAEALEESTIYSSEPSSETPNIDMIGLSTPIARTYIYETLELLSLRAALDERALVVPVQRDENSSNKAKVRLSQIFKFTHQIPRRHYQDVSILDKEVDGILEDAVGSSFTKTMGLFRLVTVGSTEQTYDNAYFFTRPFHRAVSWCSDLSLIEHEPELLQMCIAEMLVCWCWDQWGCSNGSLTKNRELLRVLAQAASISPAETYHCAGHREVMNVLCTVHSGLHYFAPKVQKPVMMKVTTVMKACATNTPCEAVKDLIPIFALAVSSTRRQSSLVVLYECLSMLVSPHCQCCLEYRDLAPPTSDLLLLLRHGLWTRQPPEVREKARLLAEKLGERFEQMEEWCNQEETSSDSMDNVVAPGAWLIFK